VLNKFLAFKIAEVKAWVERDMTWKAIEAVAERLLADNTLTHAEVVQVIRQALGLAAISP
jgi:hypothetical protein